jgi:hypothetical protein
LLYRWVSEANLKSTFIDMDKVKSSMRMGLVAKSGQIPLKEGSILTYGNISSQFHKPIVLPIIESEFLRNLIV